MEKTTQPDPVTPGSSEPWATLGAIAQMLGGQLDGPADLALDGVTSADTPNPRGIAFAESDTYVSQAKSAGVGALLLPPSLDSQGIPAVRVAIPRQAFFMLLQKANKPWAINAGIHPTAVIDPLAEVDPTAHVGAYAVIERFAKVGPKARIYPFAYIGEACSVGEGSAIAPHVVLMQAVSVGAGTTIHPGSILGADGFGYVWDGGQHLKIPQVGKVIVGDRVEIGALTAVDRAMAGETVIGDGTKLDNLIQIGHNTRIGKHTVIAALTGISGSTTIGSNVVMGGQCATNDHVVIGDNTSFAGRSAVADDITEAGEYFGVPARPKAEGIRSFLLMLKLPDLFTRLRRLEKRIQQLDADAS